MKNQVRLNITASRKNLELLQFRKFTTEEKVSHALILRRAERLFFAAPKDFLTARSLARELKMKERTVAKIMAALAKKERRSEKLLKQINGGIAELLKIAPERAIGTLKHLEGELLVRKLIKRPSSEQPASYRSIECAIDGTDRR